MVLHALYLAKVFNNCGTARAAFCLFEALLMGHLNYFKLPRKTAPISLQRKTEIFKQTYYAILLMFPQLQTDSIRVAVFFPNCVLTVRSGTSKAYRVIV